MSVIATVAVPAEEFTLGAALSTNPGIRVRLERVVPVEHTFVPYLWASDGALEDVEAALREEADVESFVVVDSADGEALVRVEWAGEVDGLLDAIAGTEAAILEGVGEADVWRFQIRFEDREHLTALYRACSNHDISIDIESVHNPGVPPSPGVASDLTDAQRETLRFALESGYFAVPREKNLVELSEELGISDSAVSQRLRRGIRTLLSDVLAEDGGSRTPDREP